MNSVKLFTKVTMKTWLKKDKITSNPSNNNNNSSNSSNNPNNSVNKMKIKIQTKRLSNRPIGLVECISCQTSWGKWSDGNLKSRSMTTGLVTCWTWLMNLIKDPVSWTSVWQSIAPTTKNCTKTCTPGCTWNNYFSKNDRGMLLELIRMIYLLSWKNALGLKPTMIF